MKNLEFNKISAAILLAGVIAMMSSFITDILFQPKEFKRGYVIEVEEKKEQGISAKKEVAKIVDIHLLIKSADKIRGAKIAKKCTACHSFGQGEKNKIGPNLYSVINRNIASNTSFKYSSALQDKSAEQWNYKNLYSFLTSPRKFAKGTKMSFAGIRKPQQIADLIKFLEEY